MIEDRELASWQEQWGSVGRASPDLEQKIQRRIKLQELRFVIGNIGSGVALVGLLIFAVFLPRQAGSIGSGWATGVCVLVVVTAGYRIWFQRGMWRSDSQSTRGFLELWQRRTLARIQVLRVSVYVGLGWLVFCAVLTAVNWGTIGLDVKARPNEWRELLVACVVMQPVIWWWSRWLKGRKEAELNEVRRMLKEIDSSGGSGKSDDVG